MAGVPRGASCSSAGELKSTVSADPGDSPPQFHIGESFYITTREFVEQYEIQISERAIGYVNTDVCMSVGEQSCCLDGMSQGPILLPAASPTLGGLYEDAVKDVTSPENDEESYYDYWSRWSGQEGNFTPEVAFNTYLFR